MSEHQDKIEAHTRLSRQVLKAKVLFLTIIRFIKNKRVGLRRWRSDVLNAPERGAALSTLWTGEESVEERALTAGKIENLRIASRALNGVVIPAGEVFSFWQHVGPPVKRRGFVIGRELQQGCLVPTIAGGICQLSNSLYQAGLDAGLNIVERHRHSQKIMGSAAELDRDATVKWNYIDLQMTSPEPWQIRIRFDRFQMKVSIYSLAEKRDHSTRLHVIEGVRNSAGEVNQNNSLDLGGCYSCEVRSCHLNRVHLHEAERIRSGANARQTVAILDEYWPEFDKWLLHIAHKPLHLITTPRWSEALKKWELDPAIRITHDMLTLTSALLRGRGAWRRWRGDNLFEIDLNRSRLLAQRASKRIPVGAEHLIVSQSLLPWLYLSGACAGRRVDVLMTRTPLLQLHARLDRLSLTYPYALTLRDFRAPQEWVTLENEALETAHALVTPHAQLAQLSPEKLQKLNWDIPLRSDSRSRSALRANLLLVPSSPLARKGLNLITKIDQELNSGELAELTYQLRVTGRAQEDLRDQQNHHFILFNGDWDEVSAVIYPTYIEHEPRLLLKALSLNIPVFTTEACGLDPHPRLTILDPASLEEWITAIKRLSSPPPSTFN